MSVGRNVVWGSSFSIFSAAISFFHFVFDSEVCMAVPDAVTARFHKRAGVQQFIKFCIVGASSTVIDKIVQFLLLTAAEIWAPHIPWWYCQSISFCLAVSNGFFWNRRWTFQAHSKEHTWAGAQYFKFIVTNTIGLGLNLLFTKLFLIAFTGQVRHAVNPDKMHVMLASLCAVPIVVVWNFAAAKFWTFRAPKTSLSQASLPES